MKPFSKTDYKILNNKEYNDLLSRINALEMQVSILNAMSNRERKIGSKGIYNSNPYDAGRRYL